MINKRGERGGSESEDQLSPSSPSSLRAGLLARPFSPFGLKKKSLAGLEAEKRGGLFSPHSEARSRGGGGSGISVTNNEKSRNTGTRFGSENSLNSAASGAESPSLWRKALLLNKLMTLSTAATSPIAKRKKFAGVTDPGRREAGQDGLEKRPVQRLIRNGSPAPAPSGMERKRSIMGGFRSNSHGRAITPPTTASTTPTLSNKGGAKLIPRRDFVAEGANGKRGLRSVNGPRKSLDGKIELSASVNLLKKRIRKKFPTGATPTDLLKLGVISEAVVLRQVIRKKVRMNRG